MKRSFVALAIGCWMLSHLANVVAAPIRYRFTGSATGLVGGISFTASPFTIDVFGDSSNITSDALAHWANPVTGSISVLGLVAQIMEPVVMRTSCGAGNGIVGMERSPGAFPFPSMLFYASPVTGANACPLLVTPFQAGLSSGVGPFVNLATNMGQVTITAMSQLTYEAQPGPEIDTASLWNCCVASGPDAIGQLISPAATGMLFEFDFHVYRSLQALTGALTGGIYEWDPIAKATTGNSLVTIVGVRTSSSTSAGTETLPNTQIKFRIPGGLQLDLAKQYLVFAYSSPLLRLEAPSWLIVISPNAPHAGMEIWPPNGTTGGPWTQTNPFPPDPNSDWAFTAYFHDPPPILMSIGSRKLHGGGGIIDLPVALPPPSY
jgi:hypothetical protein